MVTASEVDIPRSSSTDFASALSSGAKRVCISADLVIDVLINFYYE